MPTLTPKTPKGEKAFAILCYVLGGLTLLWVILSALEIGMSPVVPSPVYHAWNFFVCMS